MNNNIVSYFDIVIYADVGMDDTVASNLHRIPNENSGLNDGIGADNNIVANGIRRGNEGSEMASENIIIAKRIIRKDDAFAFRTWHLTINDNHRSWRTKSLVIILRVINKSEIADFNFMDFIDAGNLEIFFTDECGIVD